MATGFTGPAGPQGPEGPVGPVGPQGPAGTSGTTHVYSAKNNNDVETTTDPGKEVVAIGNLPAGTYVFWSTLHSTYPNGGSNGDDVYCSLLRNADKNQPVFDFPGDGAKVAFFHALTISGIASVSITDTVGLYCITAGDPTEVVANITALKVDQLNY